MTTSAIRKMLMSYIAEAEDKKVKGLYMLIEDDIAVNKKFKLSAEQIKILDLEKQKHLAGKSKSYNWEEAKEIIRNKRKS